MKKKTKKIRKRNNNHFLEEGTQNKLTKQSRAIWNCDACGGECANQETTYPCRAHTARSYLRGNERRLKKRLKKGKLVESSFIQEEDAQIPPPSLEARPLPLPRRQAVYSRDNELRRLQIPGGIFKYIITYFPLFIAGIHKTMTHTGRGLKETFCSA